MELQVAAKGVIIQDDTVLLVRESAAYEDGNQPGKWDVPGGRIHVGEAIKEGLQREVLEESGLNVAVTRCLDAFDHFSVIKGEDVHIVGVYYLCRVFGGEVNISDDHDAFEWVPLAEVEDRELVSNLDTVIAHAQSLQA